MWPVTRATSALAGLLACIAFPSPALADEQVGDIAGSYAFINAIGYGNNYPKGWLASGAIYLSNSVGVAGEVGGSYEVFEAVGSQPALVASIYDFMGGLRFVLRSNPRLTPFGQVQLGGIRVGNNYGGHLKEFAWQPGGGVDIRVTDHLQFRLQADWRFIPIAEATPPNDEIKQFRFASGVVLRNNLREVSSAIICTSSTRLTG